MRKRLLAQICAYQKLGTAVMFQDINTELTERFDSLIKELEDRIIRAILSNDKLSEMAIVLRSIPQIGPFAGAMLIGETPEIGTITAKSLRHAVDWPRSRTTAEPFAENDRRRWSSCPAARDALGGTGRGTSQPEHEIRR